MTVRPIVKLCILFKIRFFLFLIPSEITALALCCLKLILQELYIYVWPHNKCSPEGHIYWFWWKAEGLLGPALNWSCLEWMR